jgi:hypothetical protein
MDLGDEAIVRMPTEDERRRLKLGQSMPVIEIIRLDGSVELHPSPVRVASADTTESATEASEEAPA